MIGLVIIALLLVVVVCFLRVGWLLFSLGLCLLLMVISLVELVVDCLLSCFRRHP